MRTNRIAELVGTSLLTGMYILFAWAHYLGFKATHRPSLVFVVVTETLFAGAIFLRRSANSVSFAPMAWMTSLGGTVAPLLLRPVAGVDDQLFGTAIQVVATVMAAAGILSLNRSIGLLPAHRGIRRSGMYRVVRHPLYSAYTISGLGYLLSHPSVANVAVVVVGFGCQLARIVNEERLLSRDPEYLAYKAETRWRLLPFVF